MELKTSNKLRKWTAYRKHYEKSDGVFMPTDVCSDCYRTLPRLAWGFDIINKNNWKSVFDGGCKDGYVALTAAKIGMRAVGVDLAVDAIEEAAKRASSFSLKAEFYNIAVEDYVTEDKFDVAVFFELIDRVIDPGVLLDKGMEIADNILISTADYYQRFGWNDNRNIERLRCYKEEELHDLIKSKKLVEKEFTIDDGAFFVWLTK